MNVNAEAGAAAVATDATAAAASGTACAIFVRSERSCLSKRNKDYAKNEKQEPHKPKRNTKRRVKHSITPEKNKAHLLIHPSFAQNDIQNKKKRMDLSSSAHVEITFLRHAESQFNADPLDQTRDCGLTLRGIEQAQSLTGGPWPLVIVSPLRRTQDTLALSQITYETREIWECVREQRVDPCDWLEEDDCDEVKETDEQLTARVDSFLRRLHTEVPASIDRILVVSHNEFIRAVAGGDQPLHNATTCVLQVPRRVLALIEIPAAITSSNRA